jgi:hypothetical protein
MPQVLTTKATITCPHGGAGTTISPEVVIADNAGTVAAEGDSGTLACPFAQLPCVGYTLRSMGLNASTILGRKLILATDFQTSSTGLPLQISETTQFVDNSSPAPLPADGSPPASDPALLDLVPPVVIAVPPAGVFNLVTQMPASLPIAFSLSSAFPREWNLRLLNTVAGQSVDLTSGAPGAAVTPSGGGWTTPTLTVNLVMSAVFLSALGAGAHHVYCTGVSRRGLSSYGRAIMTVS